MALSTRVRTYRRAPNAAPLRAAADLCILGSGMSGVSAALEAARLGRKVILLDAAPALGGQSVGAAIGTFCGLFGNGPDPEQVTHGIADEMLRDLIAAGEAHLLKGRRNTTIVPYRIAALGRWIEEKIGAAGVTVLLGAVLLRVHRDGRRLTALDVATRYGEVTIAAAGFVDASGDAALAFLAGLDVCEAADHRVQGTQMVTLGGVDEAALAALPRGAILDRLGARAEEFRLRRRDGFVFAFPGSGEALVNMTHLETPLDPFGASAAVLDGRAEADRLMAFLKAEFPAAFGAARITLYGLPGIRQTRSIVGAYRLTADDVREGRPFPDAIARSSWPIEFHDRPDCVHWEEFGDGHLHFVPLRCLAPPETDNLLAAGRCIDADPLALSAVRVMGPCIAMGAAAAHALDLAGSGSVHQLDMAALRRRIAANLGP